jgi:uncharacterized membrane protein YgcG
MTSASDFFRLSMRPHRPAAPVAAAIALLLIVFATPVPAADPPERILSFASHITVEPDASMLVTETITVISTGEQIRRGIFRDFPTAYRDRAGNSYTVEFSVRDVLRNGKPEAWHTENRSNGVRVYFGNKDVRLPPGEHIYTWSYRTDRQLGFFPTHDELYWNVTGNGWDFRIDAAAAVVGLPDGVPVDRIELEGYTGPMGAKGRNFSAALDQDGRAVFTTTRGLGPREGLTIVVSWPKGFVKEPSSREKTVYFLKDNRTLLAAAVGLAVLLAYYFGVWAAVGKDPAKGVIVPLYAPPENFAPAAMRYVAEMGYDNKVFAAAVVNMAVKGHLAISEEGDRFTLTRLAGSATLSPEERKLAAQLFKTGDSIVLERKNHSLIGAAKNALKTSLALTYEKTHFLTNRLPFLTGVALSAVAVAAVFYSERSHPEAVFLGVWLTGWSVGVVFLGSMVVKLWQQVFSGARELGTRVGSLGAALFMTAFATPFVGAEIFVLATLASMSYALIGLLAAVVCINALFYHLLKAPTLLGRRVLDRIEGFRMFLSATEADRLQRMNPSERPLAQFEKFLPYALALDVEQAWAEQFAGVLSAADRPDGSGYRPTWYEGSRWDSSRMGSFAASVGSSLSSAISSSSAAPGSSSGRGGGGSSGGGGGGGGGGSW